MSRPDRRAVLHRMVTVLHDPAPINAGHAEHLRSLISRVLVAEGAPAAPVDRSRDPASGLGGVASGGSAWAVSGTPERLAAIAPEDQAEENPAL
ncbi:hypothetical protein [Rathayibacter toxicus]|nr:hypothetical protein [Rathayibacter toxicus]QOD11014.1 hypothetical protein BSG36_03380 [Rathayibacter toxicus]QWL27758.1 hypothetical protein E2R33_03390 [Rathayibacter toxicus]QWL29873.1 hypothetical protein E2R34_03305 [Rathayibacter toxicus]QWL31966.1 hypothetical protein E2R35_03320 [Rathayibacter toxicus]QWL34060.1 hypothetical protein E2R36_03325 [Rathayibacter toxicus]